MKWLQFALLFTFMMLVAHVTANTLRSSNRRSEENTCETSSDCPILMECTTDIDGHKYCRPIILGR